jgi:hypothetical protein
MWILAQFTDRIQWFTEKPGVGMIGDKSLDEIALKNKHYRGRFV